MSALSHDPERVFALLDDASPSDAPDRRSSRLYTGFRRELQCPSPGAGARFFDELEAALAQGWHAVGMFDYEFGQVLQRLELRPDAGAVLARVLLFSQCERLSQPQVSQWLASRANAPFAVTGIRPALDEADFATAIAAIHRYIEAGDTYQVNFTFPLRFRVQGDVVALYAALRARQPVPYGALIALPDGSSVLSLTPELFVSHQRGQLTCRPMKGTAPASGDPQIDDERAGALRLSEKERSENLMIVDLLRNDLGRIAETGSVKVPELFAVERFGSVLQMTSTITAALRGGAVLREVFDALYPCGSITGAPKRHTMALLQGLERWPRRLYTGAIGWFDPPPAGQVMGDFMLSVPIRTLLLDAPDANDGRDGELGVGAGIVYDSSPQAEYQECLLKARFLTGIAPGFELFETMHARREGCRLIDRHLARLAASAAHWGFACDVDDLRARVAASCQTLVPGRDYRLRLSLDASGRAQLSSALVVPLEEPVRLLLSPVVMPADEPLLAHKTTLRRTYDEAWQAAEREGAFDALFFNQRGELTEGGRSNVLLKLDGRWYTPPLSCGLLPGVMRQQVLEDPSWDVSERVLTLNDLHRAESIRVCNALRGVLAARLAGAGADATRVSLVPGGP